MTELAGRERIRMPAVAGTFYPGDPAELASQIDEYVSSAKAKHKAFGCIVPHAGYVYSGHVAGAVYGTLDLPKPCIVLGPNHRGVGAPLATQTRGAWQTPPGLAPIDEALAAEFVAAFPTLADDDAAHANEHSIEVQLPFLQRLIPDLRFVPICVGTSNFALLTSLGEALAAVIARSGQRIMLIASSDMNHYESDAITRVKDRKAIDAILTFGLPGGDAARRLYETVYREQISMCGFAPVVAMLAACRNLGATRAELVRYATSGDVNGDRGRVVGYAGMIVA